MEKVICFFGTYKEIIGFVTTVGLFIIGLIIERKTRKIQNLMLFKEFREPLLSFANESIDAMTEIEGLCESNPEILKQEFYNKYTQLINKVSALRDRGKLIIPNTFPEKYGTEKAEAYQGFRHDSLDCLTAAYFIAISINYNNGGYNKKSVEFHSELFKDFEQLDNKSLQFSLLKQAETIKKGLDKLPGPPDKKYPLDGPIIDGKKSLGWSSKKAIVHTKRQFVTTIQKLIRTRDWGQELIELSEKED